ncbi:hypothetical protein FQA47_001785 [Oryzias melastigma]|uniref:Uncharacterized protein n=1 Tax=Oryzias melastigma TaxID=30732 RepID=A0A834FMI6_ORYME|nr:hypothetical protein FQA47_001785 [Oryzias melastigma]
MTGHMTARVETLGLICGFFSVLIRVGPCTLHQSVGRTRAQWLEPQSSMSLPSAAQLSNAGGDEGPHRRARRPPAAVSSQPDDPQLPPPAEAPEG